MISFVTFHDDRRHCGRSQSIAGVVIDHHISQNSLMRLRTHSDIDSCPILERLALLVLDLIMTIFLFIYVPARLSLIAQALALLRSQPASALTAVDWTKYVPHLFSS